MVHARSKGNRARLAVIRYYESAGYQVSVVERTGKYLTQKDMFGLFDLVAIHPHMGLSFIQVRATQQPHPHQAYIDFANEHALVQPLEIVQYVKARKGKWTQYRYKPDCENPIVVSGIVFTNGALLI